MMVPQGALQMNEFFALTHKSPSEYFLVFDLDLKEVLRAIRYIRLLLAACPSGSRPQPILVTLNSRFKQVIEGQGIKVYNPR